MLRSRQMCPPLAAIIMFDENFIKKFMKHRREHVRQRFNWSLRLESADAGAECTERVITGALCVRGEKMKKILSLQPLSLIILIGHYRKRRLN